MLTTVFRLLALAPLHLQWLLPDGLVSPSARRPVPAAAQAYVEAREFTAPWTGEKFVATVLKSRPPVLAPDYDYCPHSTFNQLAYTLVTDPVSGWTNYPEQFGQRVLLPAAELTGALGSPKFDRQVVAGMPWLDPYPWEQFENAALQSAALKRSPLDTANWYIQAAWSVRLDTVSGGTGFEDEINRILRDMPIIPVDPSQVGVPYELQLAAYWEQQRAAGVLNGVGEQDSALALAWLYRSRGELQAARHWLKAMKLGKQPTSIAAFLADSMALEESYLRTARAWLLTGWNNGNMGDRRVGRTAFTLGEIARRLGEPTDAQQWYAEGARRHHGELNLPVLRHVQALAEGRGF